MTRTTEQKLESARKRLANANAAWDRTAPPTDDPGALSGIKGYNDTPAKVAKNINRTVRAASEAVAAEENLKRLEHQAAREANDTRLRASSELEVPVDDLKAGDFIRYENRCHPRNVGRVVRVNQKTVTIDAPEHFDKPKIDKGRIIATSRPREADQ